MAMTPREHVYYADRAIWVTDERIITAGWNHWYKRIRSVRMESVAPGKRDLLWISASLLLTACILFVQHLAAIESYKSTGDTIGTFMDSMYWATTILVLVAFIVSLFFLPRALKGVFYILRISTGLASRIIFASMDKSLAEQVLNEIAHARQNARIDSEPANPRQAPPAPLLSQDTNIQVTRPAVVGEQVIAGNNVVSLSAAKSAKVGMAYARPMLSGFVAFQLVVLLNSLTEYAYQHWRADFLLWLATFTFLVLLVCLGLLLVSFASSLDQRVYTVNLRGTFGNVIAFATLDKDEAQAVKGDVDRVIGNQQPLSPQAGILG